MADIVPISNLPQLTTPLDGDLYPVVNSGVTQKIPYSTLYTNISSKVVVGKYVPVDTYNASQSYFASLSPNWQSTYTNVQTNSAAWSATQNTIGLTIFKEISSTASPNNTTFALGFSAVNNGTTGAITNADFVAAPTGTGANLAQIPDNSATGGAKRGQYATDFQKSRLLSTQVASGNFSSILGGARNVASGVYAFAGGGYQNTASGYSSVVVGGSGNTVGGLYSIIGGGMNNSVSMSASIIGGGGGNTVSTDYSTIGGGGGNNTSVGATTDGNYSTIGGGRNNAVSETYTTIGGGYQNIVSGYNSTVGGGSSNNISAESGTIGGGSNNTILYDNSTIGGGISNYASAINSTIGGGNSNTINGNESFIGGGNNNTINGNKSFIGGGNNNTANGLGSSIIGGSNNRDIGLGNVHIIGSSLSASAANFTYVNNLSTPGRVVGGNALFTSLTGISTTVTNITGTNALFTSVSSTNLVGGLGSIASGSYSFIGGGESNTASGMNSAVLGGKTNTASGLRSVVLGGIDNDSTGIYSTTLGFRASATNYGEFAQAAGAIVYKGDNKSSTFLLRTLTNSSVLVSGSAVCYLDGTLGGYEITLPNNSTYAFTTTILGLSSQTDSSGIHSIIRGIAKCNASGVVTLYGVSQVGTLYKQPNTASFNAGMSAGGNILRVVVATPVTSNTYWTARVQGEFLQF